MAVAVLFAAGRFSALADEPNPKTPPATDPASASEGKPSPETPKSGAEQPAKKPEPAAAASPAETPVNPAVAAEARVVLKAARDKLVTFRSIQAKIVESVALGDRRFKATGSYVQGSSLKLRLEFEVQSGALRGSLLEVCDGQVLWSQYTIGKTQRITRRDVRQILEAARNANQAPEGLLVAELGLGGLPALLASVEQNMSFNVVREETIDGQAFIVLEGGWGKSFWDQWNAANPKAKNTLPEHIPDHVRIYLDQKTKLPRRFLYLKKNPEKSNLRPMVTLDFVDLVLNAPINPEIFDFIPPDGVTPDDITRAYLDRLRGTAGRRPAAEPPAETAKPTPSP